MAKVIALKPAVKVPLRGDWALMATQSARLTSGLRTTVTLTRDHRIQLAETFPIDNGAYRSAFAELVSMRTRVPMGAVEPALLKLHEGVEGTLRKPKRLTNPSEQKNQPSLPVIIVNSRFLRDIAADALKALHAANRPPSLFCRGDAWVRVRPGHTQSEPVSATMLKGILERAADFMKTEPEGELPARSPHDLPPDILTMIDPGLPALEGISTVPVFLSDGRLLATSGYDPASGLLLVLQGLEGVRSDLPVHEALRWLSDELVGDFPFIDASGKAHVLAALLERFVRPLIDGPRPLYLIDAPAQGTGKGLLADITSLVVTGASAPVMVLSRDEDEVDKRVTSMLLGSAPVILLDNVTILRSTTLAAALTTTTWRGRLLGQSKMVEIPNDATWLATGNNVELSHELARRAIPIRLDAQMERPEERAAFRHPNLPSWVQAHRVQLVSSALSLVQAWLDAESPAGSRTLGRFESWAQVLGGILEVSGVSGFLEGRSRLHADANLETRAWEAVCNAWWETFGPHPVTAGSLFNDVLQPKALLLEVWGGRSAMAAMQRLGHALSRNRDRIFGQWAIRGAGQDSRTKNTAYRLEIGSFRTPETPETPINDTQPIHLQEVISETEKGGWKPSYRETHQNTPQTPPQQLQNTCPINNENIRPLCSQEGVSGVSGVLNLPHSGYEAEAFGQEGTGLGSLQEQAVLFEPDDQCPQCGALAMSVGGHLECTTCRYIWN